MNECVLTIVDTTGIQEFIFGSNRLRENVGASDLVHRATDDWVRALLAKDRRTNLVRGSGPGTAWQIDPQQRMEQTGGLDAELLYTGGGNAVILFADLSKAIDWTQQWSAYLLQHAPDLQVAVAHSEPFAWQPAQRDLSARWQTLIKEELVKAKGQRPFSRALLGLGVTAGCQSTGLVAIGSDQEGRRISGEVASKLAANDAAKQRFSAAFAEFNQLEYAQPPDFDHLGRSHGDQSYIAVIHADGNGMGERFQQAVIQASDNRAAIDQLRKLSDDVKAASEAALHTALGALIDSDARLIKPFKALENLPFRLLVYGGDDMTLVCDGRLGLTLAARYLSAFEQETKAHTGAVMTACAGVAIVKTHYPFARAYALSESLCHGAKRTFKPKNPNDPTPSALDWHIAGSGLLGSLGEIREREYTVTWPDSSDPKVLSLAMRPVALHKDPAHFRWQTWPAFAATLQELLKEEWSSRSNKVLRLREVLREGPQSTEQYLKLYGLDRLPGYEGFASHLRTSGWRSGVCGYFDPIEALDYYIALD